MQPEPQADKLYDTSSPIVSYETLTRRGSQAGQPGLRCAVCLLPDPVGGAPKLRFGVSAYRRHHQSIMSTRRHVCCVHHRTLSLSDDNQEFAN